MEEASISAFQKIFISTEKYLILRGGLSLDSDSMKFS